MIRPAAMAVLLALAAAPAMGAGETPEGWSACHGLAADPAIWPACAEAVSRECVQVRATDGDIPWVACLKARAVEWETYMVGLSTGLRARNNPAGDSAALSRWMASRAARCHRASEIERITAELGETLAAAAVFQCELGSTIEEAMRLEQIADGG